MFDSFPFLLISLIVLVLFAFAVFLFKYLRKKEVKDYANRIVQNEEIFTPSQFFNFYENLKKQKISIAEYDSTGVYVIYNSCKHSYYVGQSIKVLSRVKNHFTGKGNGDVYVDFKYGDDFQIRIIKCEKEKMDALERHFIEKYNAFNLVIIKIKVLVKDIFNYYANVFYHLILSIIWSYSSLFLR